MTNDQLAKLKMHLQTLDGLVTDTPGGTAELLELNRPWIREEVKAALAVLAEANKGGDDSEL